MSDDDAIHGVTLVSSTTTTTVSTGYYSTDVSSILESCSIVGSTVVWEKFAVKKFLSEAYCDEN